VPLPGAGHGRHGRPRPQAKPPQALTVRRLRIAGCKKRSVQNARFSYWIPCVRRRRHALHRVGIPSAKGPAQVNQRKNNETTPETIPGASVHVFPPGDCHHRLSDSSRRRRRRGASRRKHPAGDSIAPPNRRAQRDQFPTGRGSWSAFGICARAANSASLSGLIPVAPTG
jgi:hypothetical protein